MKDNGFTVTFGSRQSNTFLRFYDKKAEQIGKCQDEKRLKELEALKCWNRMEFEFKDTNAIKIINMICDAESFGESFSEVVNGYIRFIDLDCDSNKSLCTMKKWWANFIGTVKKARLTVSDFISYSAEKTKKYFDRCLTTTVYTVMQTNGLDDVMLSLQAAENKLKHKHIDIINGNRFDGGVSCYEQLWEALRSVPVNERSEYAY